LSAAIMIALYFGVASSIALAYFNWADVTRRVG
jgi:hypothetical protein